jgi:hypothetical protein
VFVIGLSPRLADPEVLKKNEYFGKYGKIYKVVINNHTIYNGAQVGIHVLSMRVGVTGRDLSLPFCN